MNILIADDEEGFRSLLRDTLATDPTIQMSTAADGMEAWWLLGDNDQRFDLAIFDIKMPRVSGLALLRRVRACPRYRNLPVILCSGNNDRESVIQSSQLAASHYLVKPFKMDVLLAKIHEYGERRRVATVASKSPAGWSASPLPTAGKSSA